MSNELSPKVKSILEIVSSAYEKVRIMQATGGSPIPTRTPSPCKDFSRAPSPSPVKGNGFGSEFIDRNRLLQLVKRLTAEDKRALENYFDPITQLGFYEYMQSIRSILDKIYRKNETAYTRDESNRNAKNRNEHVAVLICETNSIDTALTKQPWYKQPSYAARALWHAALGQWDYALVCLENDKIDIDVKDESGKCLLDYATEQNNQTISEILKKEKNKKKAFAFAEKQKFNHVFTLIDLGVVDVNASNPLGGFAYYAVANKLDTRSQINVVEELVKRKLDLAQLQELAFNLAEEDKWDHVIHFITKGYIDINAIDETELEYSLLDFAYLHDNDFIIARLKEMGAKDIEDELLTREQSIPHQLRQMANVLVLEDLLHFSLQGFTPMRQAEQALRTASSTSCIALPDIDELRLSQNPTK